MATHTAPKPGCYIDSHLGHYATVEVVSLAVNMGMRIDPFAEFTLAMYACHWHEDEFPSEALSDLVNEAEDWLNDNNAPRGYAWGWNDGDFGLYPVEEGTT